MLQRFLKIGFNYCSNQFEKYLYELLSGLSNIDVIVDLFALNIFLIVCGINTIFYLINGDRIQILIGCTIILHDK